LADKKYPEMLKLKGKIVAEGKTQDEVAIEAGISKSAFHNKINGTTAFRIDEVYRIAEVLNISEEKYVEYFFEDLMRNAV